METATGSIFLNSWKNKNLCKTRKLTALINIAMKRITLQLLLLLFYISPVWSQESKTISPKVPGPVVIAELFSEFLEKDREGHYVNSPDTEHYLHKIKWKLTKDGRIVLESKEVPELDFYSTTIYYPDNDSGALGFIRTSNRGETLKGIAWREGDTLFLEAYDKQGKKQFKYSYSIEEDGTVTDKFYRRDTSGSWHQGHLIHYK